MVVGRPSIRFMPGMLKRRLTYWLERPADVTAVEICETRGLSPLPVSGAAALKRARLLASTTKPESDVAPTVGAPAAESCRRSLPVASFPARLPLLLEAKS